VLNTTGPFREPREPVLSYDYAIQRPTWPTPFGVRIKVSIPDELDYAKVKVLDLAGGTAGQTLILNQMLSRRIADWKLELATEEGMLNERQDVLVGPFTGPLAHLFPKLQERLETSRETIRAEVEKRVGILKSSAGQGTA
jgi:hypothetical protein